MDGENDPRPVLLAPAAGGAARSLKLPGAFPPLDESLVRSETREEMVRGRLVEAMPALPPHGDQHFRLDVVIGAHLKPGYVGSSDMLTRYSQTSQFATDTSVRKGGIDPATGERYLEELAFEVISEQRLKDVTERAEEISARGVRRLLGVLVKKGEVREWDPQARTWRRLEPWGVIEDPCLAHPLPIRALFDPQEGERAMAEALLAKGNPALVERQREWESRGESRGEIVGRRAALLSVLAARSLSVDAATHRRIHACTDLEALDRWMARAAVARTGAEVFEEP